ncbi:MAG: WD40 repeat domain-containing protein, partial [Caldilineaceae bacterium]|nr:WD40 repeat domain-containing protein [Caldilineaceae bacterium]
MTMQFGLANLRDHFARLIQQLHDDAEREPSYAGGNILNLLLYMKLDVAGFDLSALSVWQVDMQKSALAGVNLTGADLTNCLFRQTFGRLETVAITPDGQTVAIGDEYGEIRFYRVADGQLQQQLTAHTNTVTALSFSADGRLLASCAHDQTARIWSCPSGQLLHTLAIQTGSQYTVAFSGDGRLLASGAGDATIYIWDIENGEPLLALKGHTASVRSVMFVPNRHMLLSVGFDGLIFVWDLAVIDEFLLNREPNGRRNEGAAQPQIVCAARRIGGEAKASFIALALSADQSVVAAGTTSGEIYLWDFPAGTLRRVLVGHSDIVRALAFWPDDGTLISASGDTSIRVWDVPSGRGLDMLTEHQGGVWALACCPTNRAFVSCSDDATARVWEMSQQRQSILTSTIHGNVEAIEKMAW